MQIVKGKRVLLIPDSYMRDFSGAYVAQIAKSLLIELGHTVAVFSDEVSARQEEHDGTTVFPRLPFSRKCFFYDKEYLSQYVSVLEEYKPDVVFTLGSVTNKPICYWKEARRRGIKIISKIFMQDFFCVKYYANDESGLCIKCLEKGFMQCAWNGCARTKVNNKCSLFIKNCINANFRYRLRSELMKTDAVITSSKQQVEFYVKYGIPRENCYITPLYFNSDKLIKYTPTKGDYYVFVAQNRIDKGIHLLKDVLAYCNQYVKVVAAYTSQERIDEALKQYGLQPYVDSGILEMRPNCTWKTNLGDVIAASRGVVNPSVWPTTTEYVLLETLGLKKPIFTFNVGIHPEIIQNGVNGFIAETPYEMASQMNHFTHDDSLYEKISENAYKLFQTLTDWEGWKSTLYKIIEQ